MAQDTILVKKKIFGITVKGKVYNNIKLDSDWFINNIKKKKHLTIYELKNNKINGFVFRIKSKKSRLYYIYNDTFSLYKNKYYKTVKIKSNYLDNGIYSGKVIENYKKPLANYWDKFGPYFSYQAFMKNDSLNGMKIYHEKTFRNWSKEIPYNYNYTVMFRKNYKYFNYEFNFVNTNTNPNSADSALRYWGYTYYTKEDSFYKNFKIDTNLILRTLEKQEADFVILKKEVETKIEKKYGKPILPAEEVEKYLKWRFGIKKPD